MCVCVCVRTHQNEPVGCSPTGCLGNSLHQHRLPHPQLQAQVRRPQLIQTQVHTAQQVSCRDTHTQVDTDSSTHTQSPRTRPELDFKADRHHLPGLARRLKIPPLRSGLGRGVPGESSSTERRRLDSVSMFLSLTTENTQETSR